MNRCLTIVAILSALAALAAIGSCSLLFTPGRFGVTPAETETPLPD